MNSGSPAATPLKVGLVTVSMDLGAGRRGVDMGPSAIRIAGLNQELETLGYEVREMVNVTASAPEVSPLEETRTKYVNTIAEVCRQTRTNVETALEDGCVPLVLGGDHSISLGSVAGVAAHYRKQGKPIGLIWVDAHADMNTPESTPSGNIHGMVLSLLLGRGDPRLLDVAGDVPAVQPEHVSIIAARDLDNEERRLVKEAGIRVFSMTELDERGVATCIDEAIARATAGTAGVHISFDLDCIDPQIAPGVGTPVRGGITYREAHLVCEKAARSGRLLSLDMVELNPVLDSENRTARLAVGLIASALGKSIL